MKPLLFLFFIFISPLSYSQSILLKSNSFYYNVNVSTEFGNNSESGCLHEYHFSGAFISKINGTTLSGKLTSYSGYFSNDNINLEVTYYRVGTNECEKNAIELKKNIVMENTNWLSITTSELESEYTNSTLNIIYKSVFFNDDTPTEY